MLPKQFNINSRKLTSLFLLVPLSMLLLSCDSKQYPDNSAVLAKVNSEKITQNDLEEHINSTFKQSRQLLDDKQASQEVLESLVATKALAIQARKNLSEAEQDRINRKLARLEEELLVKQYLKERVNVNPVTSQMVKDYYEAHPEKFGGGYTYSLEWLSIPRKSDEDTRKGFLGSVKQFKDSSDWKAESRKHSYISYKNTTVNNEVLEDELQKTLERLNANEVSEVVFSKSDISLLRLIQRNNIAPAPLTEVSSEIRKMLAPSQLKEAVKAISDEALSKVSVTYEDVE